MDHGVTVCTHRPQILGRVEHVLRPYMRDWNDVVSVYVSGHGLSIGGLEAEATSGTAPAIILETRFACPPVPLVCVHANATSRALLILHAGRQFFRNEALGPRVSPRLGRG